jgi:proteic killer suppression protein
MKVKFNTEELEYYYITPLDNIKGKIPFSKEIIKQYKKKVQVLLSIQSHEDLKQFRSLNFEVLKGDRKGQHSIRLNLQYRLIFSIEEEKNGELSFNIILLNEISKHYE